MCSSDLADPHDDQVFFGNTFTWLTLIVAAACVLWYWSRIDEDSPGRRSASLQPGTSV